MTYLDDVKKILISKGLSAATVKLYSIKLNQLKDYVDMDFNDGFKDFKKVFDYIKNLKTDNQLSYLNAIIVMINDENLLIHYKKTRLALNSIKSKSYEINKKSDDFIEYNELLETYKKPDFTNDNAKKVIDEMLMFMAIRYPIRSELSNLIIVKKKYDLKSYSDNEINDSTIIKNNYILINNRGINLYMNQFKNVIEFKPNVIKIDKIHESVFRDYMKFLKKNDLIFKKFILESALKIREFPNNTAFSSKLTKLFKLKYPNKNANMNMVRKSYETNLINSEKYKSMTNQEKKNEHSKLLHRMSTANEIYNQV